MILLLLMRPRVLGQPSAFCCPNTPVLLPDKEGKIPLTVESIPVLSIFAS